MSTTTRHTLALKVGRIFAVTVTETTSAVYVHFSGDKPRRSELTSVQEFLWPIVTRYEEDDRPIELDSVRNHGGAKRLHTVDRRDDAVLLAVTDVLRPRANA